MNKFLTKRIRKGFNIKKRRKLKKNNNNNKLKQSQYLKRKHNFTY